jgi:integrase/recombinase XerD
MTGTTDVATTGPLAEHVEAVCEELLAAGWRPATVGRHRPLLRQLSAWAAEAHPDVLSEEAVEEFFRLRREAGFTVRYSTTGMAPVLERLRARGAIVGAVVDSARRVPIAESDPLLSAYARHMRVERSFAPTTIVTRLDTARRFKAAVGPDLGRLGADDVSGFLLGEVRRLKPSGAAKVGDGVRAFLRFLYGSGVLDRDLSGIALTVRARRQSPLPKTVAPETVQALLSGCDRESRIGRRDFAILNLLVRLGLRAVEVAAVTLDDLDWEAGELVVHGKGRRTERLPLPADVGAAIAAYLAEGRPPCATRAVFVNLNSRCGEPMSAEAVADVPGRAAARAGTERVGAHRLRHTAATGMLRAGASLGEVAQVLRHASESTTAIYAKVDRAALALCVQAWPGSGR